MQATQKSGKTSRNLPFSVLCVGGAHLDLKAKGIQKLLWETSNPVKSKETFGGVARNIAENLVRLGAQVSLISRIGPDRLGQSILDHLTELKIPLSGITRSESSRTATYTAILEPSGEMLLALSDMEIYDELTPEVTRAALASLPTAQYWVLDSNLPADTLVSLAHQVPKHTQLWVVPVSITKVLRIKPILNKIDVLILNLKEFQELVGYPVNEPKEIQKACESVVKGKVKNLVITLGKQGVYPVSELKFQFFPRDTTQNNASIPPDVVDVTGAGDAFSSGLLYGISRGEDFASAIAYGQRAAQITISSEHTVSHQLSPDLFS